MIAYFILVLGGLSAITTGALLFFYRKQIWEQKIEQQREQLEKQKAEHKHEILKSVIDTQNKERARFAADLHDALSGSIHALNLYISNIDELTDEQKKFLQHKCLTLTQRVRSISHNMMPPALQRFGLKVVLQDHCEQFEGNSSFDFHYQWKGVEPSFELPKKLNIYRIATELLQNAVKHAQASKIAIRVESQQDLFFLEVKDNGIGWNQPTSTTGAGLKNIQNRVFVIGGELELKTPPEGGTTIQVTIKQ